MAFSDRCESDELKSSASSGMHSCSDTLREHVIDQLAGAKGTRVASIDPSGDMTPSPEQERFDYITGQHKPAIDAAEQAFNKSLDGVVQQFGLTSREDVLKLVDDANGAFDKYEQQHRALKPSDRRQLNQLLEQWGDADQVKSTFAGVELQKRYPAVFKSAQDAVEKFSAPVLQAYQAGPMSLVQPLLDAQSQYTNKLRDYGYSETAQQKEDQIDRLTKRLLTHDRFQEFD